MNSRPALQLRERASELQEQWYCYQCHIHTYAHTATAPATAPPDSSAASIFITLVVPMAGMHGVMYHMLGNEEGPGSLSMHWVSLHLPLKLHSTLQEPFRWGKLHTTRAATTIGSWSLWTCIVEKRQMRISCFSRANGLTPACCVSSDPILRSTSPTVG